MLVKIDPMVRMHIEAGHSTSDPEEQEAAQELFANIEKW
jgi:hypothetical protein